MAAQANVDRWQVVDKSIHVLVENELRPGADASRADAELARAKIGYYKAQQAERAALDTLASAYGRGREGNPIGWKPPAGIAADQFLLETSASDHPLARDQMASVRQIQAQEKILQRSDYPRLFLQAEAIWPRQ